MNLGMNNYLKYQQYVEKLGYGQIYKEYNKIRLLMIILKGKGNKSVKDNDDIKLLQFKYNMIILEIRKRGYHMINKNYKRPK